MTNSSSLDHEDEIPRGFFCPLTCSIMENPFTVSETGRTYEKSAIEGWFESHSNCPATGEAQLKSFDIVPNISLKLCIDDWRTSRKRKVNVGPKMLKRIGSYFCSREGACKLGLCIVGGGMYLLSHCSVPLQQRVVEKAQATVEYISSAMPVGNISDLSLVHKGSPVVVALQGRLWSLWDHANSTEKNNKGILVSQDNELVEDLPFSLKDNQTRRRTWLYRLGLHKDINASVLSQTFYKGFWDKDYDFCLAEDTSNFILPLHSNTELKPCWDSSPRSTRRVARANRPVITKKHSGITIAKGEDITVIGELTTAGQANGESWAYNVGVKALCGKALVLQKPSNGMPFIVSGTGNFENVKQKFRKTEKRTLCQAGKITGIVCVVIGAGLLALKAIGALRMGSKRKRRQRHPS